MRALLLPLIALTLLAAGACAPEIGDACTSSLECPQGATCDTTATGGYCLVFDCTEHSCPEKSVCIPFRSFSACMLHCANNGDCRGEDDMVCRSDRGSASFCYHTEGEP